MLDLHVHSTFSDGSCTPEEIAALAGQKGIKAVALTDHDCTDGIPRFMAACQKENVVGIPGVEISADVKRGTMHVLGYFIDPASEVLKETLRHICDGRDLRNQEILQKLNKLGCAITWEEVAGHAGEDVVGRPHFAKAMLAKGFVGSREAAFDKYLAKGQPAYTERYRLSPEDSIAAIRAAGGVPVLSHPCTLDLDRNAMRVCITGLAEKGLMGIEVYYSEHSPDMVRNYLDLAKSLKLVATGGSDFHGDSNPALRLGVGFGHLHVPDSVLESLEKARQAAALTAREPKSS